MKLIGILLIIAWIIGIIGEITTYNLPKDIFEWIGNLAVLGVGICLFIKGIKNKEK